MELDGIVLELKTQHEIQDVRLIVKWLNSSFPNSLTFWENW